LSNTGEEDLVRPPGGHVEYGERSIDTVKREAKEELGIGLANLNLLGTLENIFRDPRKKLYHEIIFIYKADLSKKSSYKQERIRCKELDGRTFDMFWVDINEIKKGKIKLVPKGMHTFLNKV
jgi:ADP-ribose pyrophosphatase YjhB (NUDIX family)